VIKENKSLMTSKRGDARWVAGMTVQKKHPAAGQGAF
jgi:hypothetical protein